MSKSKIVDFTGREVHTDLPKVVDVTPYGSSILVEILKPEEVLGTNLAVHEATNVGCPQAYVLKFGPKVPEDLGFKVGSRVMLTGTCTPVPNFNENPRDMMIVEVHNVKAVLTEK